MPTEFSRSAGGVVTIAESGSETHSYSVITNCRFLFLNKQNELRIFVNEDGENSLRHSYKMPESAVPTNEYLIQGVAFVGSVTEFIEALNEDIFIISSSGGSGSMSAAQIAASLETLAGDSRLDASAIKDLPAGDGTSIARVATYADIGVSTTPRIIIVLADETESGSPKVLYIHDGTSLHKIAILLP